MRLVTFDTGGAPRAGVWLDGFAADLEHACRASGTGRLPGSVREILAGGPATMDRARQCAIRVEKIAAGMAQGKSRRPSWLYPAEEVHLCAPVPDPEKIICLGLNYKDHAKEQKATPAGGGKTEAPKNPMIFAKYPSALAGPHDPIRLPASSVTKMVDYEVELAAVIGCTVKKVSKGGAMACIAGYMVINDVSARDCQFADKQFTRAKSFDTFAPCGPWLVTPEEVGNPHKLRLYTLFNGELMQDASTAQMIHKLDKTIAYLSQGMTLKAGDIIATGTPAGVGVFREEQVLLKPGATVECGVEGVGVIRNPVVRG